MFTDDGAAGWARGNAELAGVNDLTLRASLDVEFNNTDAAVDVPDGSSTRTIDDSALFRIAGSAALKIAHFIDLAGDFSFKKSGSGDNRTIEVSVAHGADKAAAIIFADNTFAAAGDASVSLPDSIDGLSLDGTLALRVNTSGREDIDTTIGTVAVNFDAGEGHLIQASGTATLGTPVGDASGTLHLARDLATNEVRGSASDISVFLGDRKDAGDDSDDVGVTLTGAGAFLIRPDGTYAFQATGGVALSNVGDVTFDGDFSAEVNTTGADVDDDLDRSHGRGRREPLRRRRRHVQRRRLRSRGQLRGREVHAARRRTSSRARPTTARRS